MRRKFAISSMVSILIFFLCLYVLMGSEMSNITAYVASVILSCLCFIVLFALFSIKDKKSVSATGMYKLKQILASNSCGGGIPAVAILLSIGMAYILDNNGNDMLGKYIFVDKNVFLVAILFSFILFFALRKVSYIQWEIVRKCIEVLDLVVCVWIGFKPNVLKDTYNYNAYWLNVVQIYNHVPFSVVNMSFYGHYSLLMLPYFKIFGLNAISVALLQAIENAVICIAMTYCIRKITRNELLRICGTIGIMYYTGVSAMLYPQGFPHRLVPITVMLALGCKAVYSANKKLWWTIGYVASLLFIIWSTEIGVVVLAAWSILVFMYSYSSERNWKEKTGSCIIAIILMPVIFVCAWKSVSLISVC